MTQPDRAGMSFLFWPLKSTSNQVFHTCAKTFSTLSMALTGDQGAMPISRISVRRLYADSISYHTLLQVTIELSVTTCCKENSLQ
jgi:hypothetical protein